MTTSTISLSEKTNQRKARSFSLAVHALIVLLMLFPFLTREDKPDMEPKQFVEIQFTDFKSSSKKSAEGDKKEELDAEKKVETTTDEAVEETETVPEPVVEEAKPEPETKPEPEPKPERAPVVTSPDPNPPVRTSPEKPKEKVEQPRKKPKKVVVKPDPKPRKPTRTKPKRKRTRTPSKKETGKSSDKKQDGKTNNTNSGGGQAAEGGTDATSGKTDSGTSVGDFPGDGLFNRKVVYRADVKKVTKEEGKIVIDLCVNRDGRVVYSKYNKAASTIRTTSVLRKALEVAQQYRFERDYTAPDKQCGKLTFIFEIEKE